MSEKCESCLHGSCCNIFKMYVTDLEGCTTFHMPEEYVDMSVVYLRHSCTSTKTWPLERFVQRSFNTSTCLLTRQSIPLSSSNPTCNFTPLHLSFLLILAFGAAADPCIRVHLANRADCIKKDETLRIPLLLCSFCWNILHLCYI